MRPRRTKESQSQAAPWTITGLQPEKGITLLKRGSARSLTSFLAGHQLGEIVMAPVVGIYGVSRTTRKKLK